jgi:hypothetical protein
LEGLLPRRKGGTAMIESKIHKSDLKIPKFATEAEEAKWWYENQELILKEFQKAAKEGRLGRGGRDGYLPKRAFPFQSSNRLPRRHRPLRFVLILTTLRRRGCRRRSAGCAIRLI